MTNTFLLTGERGPDEIVAQTPTGVYVAKLGGGQVNTTTGDFVFGTTEAYLIEDGRITEPLRDANLIGNGPEILKRIDAVATDFAMTPGYVREGRPERAGRMRSGHAAADRRHHRGNGRVSDIVDAGGSGRPANDPEELMAVAERVAGWARTGEEVEVYVARGDETEVRAFGGGGGVADLGHVGRHRHPAW